MNYGSGTPEQAAAWVALYNGSTTGTAAATALGTGLQGAQLEDRSAFGPVCAVRRRRCNTDDGYNFLRVARSTPWGVKYWEIGNECYGGWEMDQHGGSGTGLSGTAQDPYTYAQAFKTYYTAMLAVDPTIHIGAVSVPSEDAYGVGTHPVVNFPSASTHTGWTAVMLATMKSPPAVAPHFLIDHDYTQNPGDESDAGLLQTGPTIASDAAAMRRMLTDYLGASTGSNVELALTELNSVSTEPGKQSVSLVNGLFMADALGCFAQTEFNACTWWAFRNGEDTRGNNSSSLYGWRNYGDYGVVASGDITGDPANSPYPSYLRGQVIDPLGARGRRWSSARRAAYRVHSRSTVRSFADGSMSLLVINKHPTSDLTAQISLNNFTPASTAAPYYTYGKSNDLAIRAISPPAPPPSPAGPSLTPSPPTP